MKRKFEEKREITETISRTVCDICGEVVMDDKPFVRLFATDDNRPVSWDDTLEVCTPACLAKNIKGIKLILDGKMIPLVNESPRKEKYEGEKCDSYSSSPAAKIYVPIHIGK